MEHVHINVPLELRLFFQRILFDLESITVPNNTLRNTELTLWIGKLDPISVSISSNLIAEPKFICNEDPLQLICDLVSRLINIAEESTLLMRLNLNDFVHELEEKYWGVRLLVPVKDKQLPIGAEPFFDKELEPDGKEDEDLEIRGLRCVLRQET